MNFKVTTLCANNIGHRSQNLIGEHGLSFYVEAGDRRVQFDTDPVSIAPGMTSTGEIPFENDFEAVEPDFFIKGDRDYPADTLPDERALILDSEKGLVVLLGCSHRGVVNTLNHVSKIAGRSTIHAILVGLHLGKASNAKLDKIVDHLPSFELEKIGVGHCTGPTAFVALANSFKEKVYLNTVGNVMEF